MKRSTKAALLSGLVFPGLGHIYLKQYVHGIILSAGAASALFYIVSIAVDFARDIAEKIQSGDVQLDIVAITSLVSQQMSSSEQTMNIARIVLVICWVVGIVDSYRQGRTQEKVEEVVSDK